MVPLFIASHPLLALGRRVDITVTTLKSASLEALESIGVVRFRCGGRSCPGDGGRYRRGSCRGLSHLRRLPVRKTPRFDWRNVGG